MDFYELKYILDEEKPHSFGDDRLITWLNEVEADVQEQLGISPFIPITSLDDKLSAPIPYDRLYVSFMKAKIDYALEDYGSYENNQAQHVSDFRDYVSWLVRTGQSAKKQTKFKGIY